MRGNKFLIHTLAIITVFGLAAPGIKANPPDTITFITSREPTTSERQAALVASAMLCANTSSNTASIGQRLDCVAEFYPKLLKTLKGSN